MGIAVDAEAVAIAAGWEDGYLGIPGAGTVPGCGPDCRLPARG